MSSNELQEFAPKEVNQNGVVWFDSRDIHTYVESKQRFADWIQNRITEIGATEGVDYVIHKFMNNPVSFLDEHYQTIFGPILNR